ncbi:VIT1/CCC1 transporter family protein [Candidatus Woesearchaeota archaeon]|nr:VIT1/CCC1 transporter family protein [Candidatus Woesearchaeota archaeon]
MRNAKLFHKTKGLIRDFVFGMQDGLISNLGLVLGVWQGGGGKIAIVLAGLSSMFAGAFSMSTGSYLSAKSQREVYEQEIRMAQEDVKNNPNRNLKKMQPILQQEGFDKDEVQALLNHFKNHNQSTFTINYIQKKLGLSEQRLDLPLKNAFTMFLSFLVGSLFPILPFAFLENSTAVFVASSITIVVLFMVGWTKSLYTKMNFIRSGLEIVTVGIISGIIGYIVGYIFSII